MTQLITAHAVPRFAGRFQLEAPHFQAVDAAEIKDLATGLASDEFAKTQATITGLGDDKNPVVVELTLHHDSHSANVDMPNSNKANRFRKEKAESFTAFFKRLGEAAQAFVDGQLGEVKKNQAFLQKNRRASALLKADVEGGNVNVTKKYSDNVVEFEVEGAPYRISRDVHWDGDVRFYLRSKDSEGSPDGWLRIGTNKAGQFNTFGVFEPESRGTYDMLVCSKPEHKLFEADAVQSFGKQVMELMLAIEKAVLPPREVPRRRGGFEADS